MFSDYMPLILILIIAITFDSTASAQNSKSMPPDAAVEKTIDNLYESIRFNDEKEADYELFRTLFTDDAKLISVGDSTYHTFTVLEFIENMEKQLESGSLLAFNEFEIHRETERYANIIHIFSTYKIILTTRGGKQLHRGINSIQMLKTENEWEIASLTWYTEDEKHPLPAKYLPHSSR